MFVRIRHGITFKDEATKAGELEEFDASPSSPSDGEPMMTDTQIFLVVEPLNIRLPPSVLEFVVQVSSRLKTFSKLAPIYASELHSLFPGLGGGGKSPFPPRLAIGVEPKVSSVSIIFMIFIALLFFCLFLNFCFYFYLFILLFC